MPKVVINVDYGGFGLSDLALPHLTCHQGDGFDKHSYNENRTCPALVSLVEQLGALANGQYAKLAVVNVPDDVKWYIHEYDGSEAVYEDHRVWYGGSRDGLTVREREQAMWAKWEDRMRASGAMPPPEAD
jgi:hypothetical protein